MIDGSNQGIFNVQFWTKCAVLKKFCSLDEKAVRLKNFKFVEEKIKNIGKRNSSRKTLQNHFN